MKYHYVDRRFTNILSKGLPYGYCSSVQAASCCDLLCEHCQVGSLAGAAHLLNHNAGVLRGTHGEQKSPVEQKGKSPLDFDFQCEYKP